MECPACGCNHCPVRQTLEQSYTYRSRTLKVIRRYRVCRHCKKSFVTIEKYRDEDKIRDLDS